MTWKIKKSIIVIMCLFFAASTGCQRESGPPTRSHAYWAERERSTIKKLMMDVEKLIRANDYEAIVENHVHAWIPPRQLNDNYAEFKRVTWIPEMSGYQMLNLEEALEAIHWRDLTEGEVILELEVSCGRGLLSRDYFELSMPEDTWRIINVDLRSPDIGQWVDIGYADRSEISALIELVFDNLRRKDVDAVEDLLPDTYEAKYREERRDLFDRMFFREEKMKAFQEDLKSFRELHIETWPEISDGFPAKYAGNLSVVLTYELNYTSDDGDESGAVVVEVYVRENSEREWELRKMRLFGEPIN